MISTIGEKDDRGTYRRLAYATGFNPHVDDFDEWWGAARREFGGDDFGEYFDVTESVFETVLNGTNDLLVSAPETHI